MTDRRPLKEIMAIGDPEADSLIEKLLKTHQGLPSMIYSKFDPSTSGSSASFFNSLESLNSDEANKFLEIYTTTPEWVSIPKLQRAQQIYKTNLIPMNIGLAVALIESYSFPVDADVLVISGRLADREKTILRLVETSYWIHTILDEGLSVDRGIGRAYVAQVRLIHALSRRRCAKSAKWENEEVPINQATLGGTLILFCQVVMEVALLRGIDVTEEDKDAYMHFWRYVGYLIGIQEEFLLDTYKEGLASRLSETYRGRQLPNETSRSLTKVTLDAYANVPGMPFSSDLFLETLRMFWRDEKLEKGMGIPPSTLLCRAQYSCANVLWATIKMINQMFPILGNFQAVCLGRYFINVYLDILTPKPKPGVTSSATCPMGY
eukprot:TRINITY_DN2825_c0_g1_i1.p1 TRINITY_DN2825_c0_g1~~TRINITY_DN2825_c0_g1_i1.p1  ORF type:complete len:378 (+),score=46.66 TRINITY_DN2825_c0_g1_i1:292-1425(+)